MATDLLVFSLVAIAIGVFTIAIRIGRVTPAILALGAHAERLERENTEQLERKAIPFKIQKMIENSVRHTPTGSEPGMKCFILEMFGKKEGDEYFSKHPEDAARFKWLSDERRGAQG